MRWPVKRKPRWIDSGEPALYLPTSFLRQRHELALTISLIAHRPLFGLVYGGIVPQYFSRMPYGSGVYVCPVADTYALTGKYVKPGDIDLLIIPYERDELILDYTLAIEIKVLRATFIKQGKSPNSLGFSQAEGLRQLGFPYVAVVHLIVSDDSPRDAWKPMGVLQILNENGSAKKLPDVDVDWMPFDLMRRTIGRLVSSSTSGDFGLASVYLGSKEEDIIRSAGRRGMWFPECEEAKLNYYINTEFLYKIGMYFERNVDYFFDNPRFDRKLSNVGR